MRAPRLVLMVILILALGLLAVPPAIEAQVPQRVFRIGVLTPEPRPPDVATYDPGFAREMLALGWVEGQHYVREYRFADGTARLPVLAAELVALPVDVIQAPSTRGGGAATAPTATVPIVFQIGQDPVQWGLVVSFARPGGNVTGYTEGAYFHDKQVQLLKEAVPQMSRVGVLCECSNPTPVTQYLRTTFAAAARTLGVQVQYVPTPGDRHAHGLCDEGWAARLRAEARAG